MTMAKQTAAFCKADCYEETAVEQQRVQDGQQILNTADILEKTINQTDNTDDLDDTIVANSNVKTSDLDSVIEQLTREVTPEDIVAETMEKMEREKEIERKKWEKLFNEGKPVEWKYNTNNPLEVFQRIRYGHANREGS